MSSAAHTLGFSRAHCPCLPPYTSWLQFPHHLQAAILKWSQKPPSRALPTSATQAAAPLIGLTQLPVLLTLKQGLTRGGGPWYLSVWTHNHLYWGHSSAPKSRSGLCPTKLTPIPLHLSLCPPLPLPSLLVTWFPGSDMPNPYPQCLSLAAARDPPLLSPHTLPRSL